MAQPETPVTVTSSAARRQALVCLQLAVLLFGCAGVIGKVLSSRPLVVACVRSLLAAVVLLGLVRPTVAQWQTVKRHTAALAISGLLLGVHWWSFFEAVQRSTVGLGLLTFASYPVFVCLLSWPVLRERPGGRTWAACGAVVAGLGLLVPDWSFGSQTSIALSFGLASGLSFALLTLLNRRLTEMLSPLVLVMVQTGIAGLGLLAVLVPTGMAIPKEDYGWLAFLGIFCTALAHACFTASLARLQAGTVAITTALEPVYGILLARLLLGERADPGLLAGGALIVGGALFVAVERRSQIVTQS
jgi:drug/metabolite transporter (DMT)-like permease